VMIGIATAMSHRSRQAIVSPDMIL
jgi:hypothetical protein